jgi:hypothetical protein
MAKQVEKNTSQKKENVLKRGNKAPVSPFAKMANEELVARYKANVAERKRLSAENKELVRLYKIAKAQKKPALKNSQSK